jgi:UDP-N-acetylmuramoyl-tripeptide--D-alanyl-D-alanine ligase
VNGFRWTAGEVARVLGLPEPDDPGREFPRVSTDTRALAGGDLFVALSGDRFDAHDFLGAAAEAGAAGAVVSRIPEGAPEGLAYFVVPDPLRALGALGRHRRERLGARVLGVVGSNGKTTTKDLVKAALGARWRVHATRGNLNNQIGVPLTLLSAPDDAEVLVVEMGTNEPGEIAILREIVRPDAVLVTSIGEEHLEKLESLEGVLEEETSVLRGPSAPRLALVAEEPPELPARARELMGAERVRTAGFSDAAELRPDGGAAAVEVQEDGTTRWSWEGIPVHLPLPGRFHVRNALLALGIAREWGVAEAEAVKGVEAIRSASLRGEWRRVGEMRVLADCYNSNPPSVAAALDLLAALPAGGRKVAVLGTMRELGASADALHSRVAADAVDRLGRGLDLLVATGAFVSSVEALGATGRPDVVAVEDPLAAYDEVRPSLRGDETVLLKASRGEALERWLPLLERDFGRQF